MPRKYPFGGCSRFSTAIPTFIPPVRLLRQSHTPPHSYLPSLSFHFFAPTAFFSLRPNLRGENIQILQVPSGPNGCPSTCFYSQLRPLLTAITSAIISCPPFHPRTAVPLFPFPLLLPMSPFELQLLLHLSVNSSVQIPPVSCSKPLDDHSRPPPIRRNEQSLVCLSAASPPLDPRLESFSNPPLDPFLDSLFLGRFGLVMTGCV